MGNHQAYGQDITQKYKLIDDELEYKVYASPSGQEYQKYIVMHDGTDHFEKKYQFRVENKHNDLVNVIYAGVVPGIMVCTGWNKYQVVTERIPYRLDSLSAIQPKNSFVILSAALRGFKDLYKQHGAIGIKQTMIGINRESRVKVWLNSNFSINKPEEFNSQSNKSEQEKHLLQNIFNMINLKTEPDQLWRRFIDFKNHQNPKTFDEFLETIQRFSTNNRINIGNTVMNIFNKSYYQQKANEPIQPINNTQRIAVNTFPTTIPQMRRPFEQIQSKFLPTNHSIEQPKPIIQNKRTESIMIQQTTNRYLPLSHQNLQPKFINTHIASSKPIHITFNKQNTFSAVPIFTTNQAKEIVPFSDKPPIVIQTKPQIFSGFNQIKNTQSNYSLAINPSNNQLSSNSLTQVSNNINIEVQKQQPKLQKLQNKEFVEQKEKIIDGQFQKQKQQIILQEGQQYQINIRQVSSQQSFHQQLAPLIEHQPPQNEAIQVIQTRQNHGLPNIEQIKSQLNPSLVKTQEIKHQNHGQGTSLQAIVYERESRIQQNTRSKFSKNLTYRQMRRMLLEHLQN